MIAEPLMRRLVLARFLFRQANDLFQTDRDVERVGSILSLHDAIEVWMGAAIEHVGASIKSKADFVQQFDALDSKSAQSLTHWRSALVRLNAVRVPAKHHGIFQDRGEVLNLITIIQGFLESTTQTVFGIRLSNLSLLDHLPNSGSKTHVMDAERHFNAGRYLDCLIECRKAFFREFEQNFDVRSNQLGGGWLMQNGAELNLLQQYQSIFSPFDQIVLDTNRMEATLSRERINHSHFWNVRQLTPAVYELDGRWLVKRDFTVEDNASQRTAAYVLEQMTEILLLRNAYRRSHINSPPGSRKVKLLRESVPVYQRASTKYGIIHHAGANDKAIAVLYGTPGLDKGELWFWQAMGFSFTDGDEPKIEWAGFVLDEDIELLPRT